MSTEEITSEHSCTRITQVLEELEALRLEMGRTRDARVPIHVSNASPREVFYHAQTVHRKANQLCVELGADPVGLPVNAAPARARPADVVAILDSTRERLARARALLRLDGDTFRPELPGPLLREAGKTASDVLAGCLVASRQLNVMLEHAFASRDGRVQLIRALGLAEALLARHGIKLPAEPPLERRKFPRDVFQRLWQACEVLQRVMIDSRVSALEIHRGFVGEEPTDVFDLASLIVSELEYLASFSPIKDVPPQAVVLAAVAAVAQAPILPAHNFRLAVQLQSAIDALAVAVRARPDWLPGERA